MKITVDTNIGTIYKWRKLHQITLLVTVFFAATHAAGGWAVLLQDALTKPSKVMILLNFNLNTYIFTILFMKCCCLPKYYTCLEEKQYQQLELNQPLFHVKSFLLKNSWHALENENSCYSKGKQLTVFVAIINVTFELAKLKFLESLHGPLGAWRLPLLILGWDHKWHKQMWFLNTV